MNRRNVFALTVTALAAMAAGGSMRLDLEPALPAERALPSPVPSFGRGRSRFAPNPSGWGRRWNHGYTYPVNTSREQARRVRQMARASAKLAAR